MSIQATSALTHSFKCLVLKLFTALGNCMALACSGTSTSSRTEIPQFGFALIKASRLVQSSPSSNP